MTHTIKWTDWNGNDYYLHNRDGNISMVLFNGTPVGLSNINPRRAEELRIALGECASAEEMVGVMKSFGEQRVVALTKSPEPQPIVSSGVWKEHGGRNSVSSLVRTLANAAGSITTNTRDDPGQETLDLAHRAFELSRPINDWESAAREAGWKYDGHGILHTSREGNNTGDEAEYADSWQEACEISRIEPHQHEIHEHWIVSDWLAGQLAAAGEKVDENFDGLPIWARTRSSFECEPANDPAIQAIEGKPIMTSGPNLTAPDNDGMIYVTLAGGTVQAIGATGSLVGAAYTIIDRDVLDEDEITGRLLTEDGWEAVALGVGQLGEVEITVEDESVPAPQVR